MFGNSPSYLPKNDTRLYQIFSLVLYVLFSIMLIYGILTFLFPYQRYSFDFANPDANKNNLFEPQLDDAAPVTKGKIPPHTGFKIYANNPQVLESGDITLHPSNKESIRHLEGAKVTVRRGYAATFSPIATSLDIPERNIVEYEGNFYELRATTLYPFVSQAAAHSYVPSEHITLLTPEVFSTLSISDEILGFRPGTLLAYADGVFFVTEDALIRPFGSAEVLLRAGYTFEHIIPASGEDVGIYKRGKIILPGELHPGGTLFRDTDTGTTYLFQEKKLHPLSESYAIFLQSHNDVITFSSELSKEETSCTLSQKILRSTFACQFITLSLLAKGNDYQIALAPTDQETDIATLEVGLQSSRKNENAQATFRSLTNRVLERLGLY